VPAACLRFGTGRPRPVVVRQHERFNRTTLATAVVVAITSRLKYAELPGNVRLRKGEAGLPRASVVNVTQIATVDRPGSGLAWAAFLDHDLPRFGREFDWSANLTTPPLARDSPNKNPTRTGVGAVPAAETTQLSSGENLARLL